MKECVVFFFSSSSTGAMSGLRKHVTMGLVLLVCTLTGHCSESAPSAAPAAGSRHGDAQHAQERNFRRTAEIVEIVRHVEDSRGRHGAKTEAPATSRARSSAVEPKDLRLKTDTVVGE